MFTGVYFCLLLLIGIYSNLLDPFDRKELIFSFFPIRFHIPFCEKTDDYTKKCKGFLLSCWCPLKMLYCGTKMWNQSYRKESSFFQKPSDPIPDLMLTPTSHYWGPYSRIEDYGLEVSITPWFSSGAELTRAHIPENKKPDYHFLRLLWSRWWSCISLSTFSSIVVSRKTNWFWCDVQLTLTVCSLS